jgi:hypothetical protein
MEVWPTARTFGSLKLAFSDPHSLIKQSLKVHFECKLDYNFVLLRSYVVLSLTSSLVYDSASMCCIQGAMSFSPTGKNIYLHGRKEYVTFYLIDSTTEVVCM